MVACYGFFQASGLFWKDVKALQKPFPVSFVRAWVPEPSKCPEFKRLISAGDLEVDQTVSTIQELIMYSLAQVSSSAWRRWKVPLKATELYWT